MQKRIIYTLLGWLMLFGVQKTFAQTDTLCDPNENKKIFGELYFNYGSVTNAYSAFNRSTMLMGQPFASDKNMLSIAFQAGFGAYSPWFLPPQPPILLASQGDYKDRIKISWNVNPLSPAPSGFVIYRDGSFLVDLDENVRDFLDFNVQAGEYYEYSIVAKNVFGTGSASKFVGFVNPNGVVTGKVETNSGNPVPGVEVRLTPLTGNSMSFDGVNDELCVTYNDEFPTDKFTVSAYVKLGDTNDEGAIIDWGSSLNKNWWITTTRNNEAKGFIFHVGNGTSSDSLKYYLPNPITNPTNNQAWHQITMVYNGSALSVLVDGEFIGTKPASIVREKNYLNIGSKIGNTGFFKGKIDDIRVYNRPLTQTEVNSTKNRSVSKTENGLISYWKMDEGVGLKVFDNTTIPTNANVYGATFSGDKPEVYSAGITDVTGYYVIDGINYSQTESFRATPMKNFDFNSSLEFNAADKSYGNLTDYDMPDTSTVELLFYPFDLKSRQTIASKGNLYETYINNGSLFLNLNGTTTDLGAIKAKFYHLAVTLDNTAGTATIYLEGELKQTVSFIGTSNWKNGSPWLLATNNTDAATGNFYTGLVDEFYIYKTALPQNEIQKHFVLGVPEDSTTAMLFSHFDLNEGSDTKIYDYATINFGSSIPREGTILKASWSNNSRRKQTKPHEFEPNIRIVNINTSNTAIGNIDFKDVSTVNVSGYVRFSNTFCFEDKVEIKVNGQSYFPPIYTDEDGKWSADFEPGKTIKLTAEYKDHLFGPSFFELRKLQAPKAGIVFLDNTKRTIRGQVAGNDKCRKSIIPSGSRVVVKVATLDGCFEKTDTLRNPDGKFIFRDLPARAFRVSIVEHSNSVIYNFFQNKGGQEVDLRDIPADTVDFIYTSAPIVETSTIPNFICGNTPFQYPILNQGSKAKIDVKIFESYTGGNCYLDTGTVWVRNFVSGTIDTLKLADAKAEYTFTAGAVNIIPPYTQNIEMRTKINGADGILPIPLKAIVLGEKPRGDGASFISKSPPIVVDILRDPPGDGSYAFREKGGTTCGSIELSIDQTYGDAQGFNASIGPTFEAKFFGIAEVEYNIVATTNELWTHSKGWNNGIVDQVCFTSSERIQTSDSEDFVGPDGDVFIGTTMNYKFTKSDKLSINTETCTIETKPIISVSNEGFNSTFIYSRHYIENTIVKDLLDLDKKEDAEGWINILKQETARQKEFVDYRKGGTYLTIDAGANIEKSWTNEKVETKANGFTKSFDFTSENSLGLFIANVGAQFNFNWSKNKTTTGTSTKEETKTNTYGYVIADDDQGDGFAVLIKEPSQNNIRVDGNKISELVSSNNSAFEPDQDEVNPAFIKTYEGEAYNCRDTLVNLSNSNVSVSNGRSQGFKFTYKGKEFDNISRIQNGKIRFKICDYRQNAILPEHIFGEYASPMFALVAGVTSCPHEEGSKKREKVFITSDVSQRINVPANSSAVYTVKLGNESPSEETRTYLVKMVNESNPDGAIVKINGVTIGGTPIPISVKYRETIDQTLTIEKGPVKFDYRGIKIAFYSECEYDQDAITDADSAYLASGFYKEISLDATFIEPCSPVDIGFPLQDWVITPAAQNILNITLNEYDKNDTDLKLLRLQYRPIGGDGSWININETLKVDLGDVFTIKQWNTSLLKDGLYEIRAVAECFSPTLTPGISTVIKGEVARNPPEIVGVPEPGDGTWDPGDEISITFNEPINCDKVVQADILANNTIGLYDATTNALVDATISCVGNKIVIVPNINPVFFENRTFRVVVSGKDYDDAKTTENPNHLPATIRDKAGNMIPKTIKWEFAVNQNNLEWVGTDVIETNEVLKPFSIKRQIRNRGGSITSFRMESIPSWLTVTPSTGTLNPGQVADVTLTFQQDLLIGDYLDTLKMHGSKGDEPLLIDYRVRCPQPVYTVDNPSQYEGSMNMVIDLSIFGVKSKDPSDVVVAKIDGQVRGVGRVQYYRNIPTEGIDPNTGLPNDSNRWLTFITIYGNSTDIDKPVEFAIWDGDKCNEYVEVLEQITYEEGGLVGSPLEPQPIHVLNLVKKSIPLNRGFNWVSFNLNLGVGNNTFTKVLSSLKHKEGAMIKTDDNFAVYENGGWDALDDMVLPTKRYLLYVSSPDTITIKGEPFTASSFPITIKAKPQWNWLGYVPSTGMTVTQALRGLTPLNGDIIKSQTLFAQYVAGVGWIGNLSFLEPLKGYLLRISNTGNLTYNTNLFSSPVENGGSNSAETISDQSLRDQISLEAPMIDDFTKYQSNMNLIGRVNGMTIDPDDELRAYIDGKLVGRNKSISHEVNRLFFNTIYFEDEKNVSFKLFKADRNKEYDLDKNVQFKADALAGLVEDPIVFELVKSSNPPVTLTIEDQIIKQPDTVFGTVSIPASITENNPSCGLYAVSTILPSGTETKPTCTAQTLEGSMTSVIKVYFNELSSFVSDQDALTFINPATGETVGCGVFRANNSLFYTTISGAATSTAVPLDVVYFSNSMKKSFTLKKGFIYNYNTNRGTGSNPHKLDFSPLAISVDANGVITATLRDTSWIGSYGVKAFAMNCTGFNDGEATFHFRRIAQNDCSYSFSTPTTNSPVCKGGTISLGANKGTSYSWTGPNGFSSTMRNPQIESASTAANGVYTLTVTSYRCPITATTNITVKALNISVGSNAPLCENSTLTLSSSGGTTYAWRGPNGFTSTAQNPEISSVSPAASGTYTVVMTNDGCKDSTTIGILVKLLPVIEMDASISICESGTLQLGSNGGNSYLWAGPNSFSSTLQNPQITNVDSANAGIYTATVTLNGCTSTASSSVVVKPLPPIPTISGSREICAGTSTELKVSEITNATYSWSNGSTGLSISVSPSSSQNYTVTAMLNGCIRTSDPFNVIVNPLYTSPTITANNMQICKGESVVLSASCPAVTDIFRWETPTQNEATASNTNTRIVTEPGVYTGYCEPTQGCPSAKVSITITQGSNCNGLNFITVTPNKPIICPNTSITLSASGCSGTLTWFGGESSQTGSSVTFSPTITTTYLVQCSSGGSASVDVVVASANINVNSNILTGIEKVKATETIESDKRVGDNNFTPSPNVIYEAGKSILLKPGFIVDRNAIFKAEIKGCN